MFNPFQSIWARMGTTSALVFSALVVFGPLRFGGVWSSPLWWCLVLSSLVVFGPLLFGGVWSSPLWWCLVLSSLVVFGPLLFGGVWSSPLWWCLVLSSLVVFGPLLFGGVLVVFGPNQVSLDITGPIQTLRLASFPLYLPLLVHSSLISICILLGSSIKDLKLIMCLSWSLSPLFVPGPDPLRCEAPKQIQPLSSRSKATDPLSKAKIRLGAKHLSRSGSIWSPYRATSKNI